MTLLTIAKEVAPNVGVEMPDTVQDTEPTNVRLVQFINESAREIVRRVDWNALTKQATITGDGVANQFALPDDFDRLASGMVVSVDGVPVRGGLSNDEWFSLTHVAGTPRYFKLMKGFIGFYPFPANGQELKLTYQGTQWAAKVDATPQTAFLADTDTTVLHEGLIARGAVWRFRRHGGQDYSDYLAEFETMLLDEAKDEGGVREP